MRHSMLIYACLATACGGESTPCAEAGKCAAGTVCASDSECASELCRWLDGSDRQCAMECASEADCPSGLVCGVDPERREVSSCQPPCTTGDDEQRVACADGVRTRCEELRPGEECWNCGCADGEYCPNSADPSGESSRCRPKRERGETCYDGRYCLSGNCSAVVDYKASEEPGTCIAAQGAPCEDECTFCLELTPDKSACVAQCTLVYDPCPKDDRASSLLERWRKAGLRCTGDDPLTHQAPCRLTV